jgi:hypothetical protein
MKVLTFSCYKVLTDVRTFNMKFTFPNPGGVYRRLCTDIHFLCTVKIILLRDQR